MGQKTNKTVKNIEEVLSVLYALHIPWRTVNKIENSLWDTGVAFFAPDAQRVAYYDETQGELTISN